MNNWTLADDLKAQLRRLWDRGDLLRSLVAAGIEFPLRLTLKGPASSELAEHFDAVRAWVANIAAVPHIRLDWSEVNHRVLGLQRLPKTAWVDRLDDAITLAGKRAETARFHQLLTLTRLQQPVLLEWLRKRPLQAVELAVEWPHLLAVVGWLAKNPRPGIYLRQVDIPGIHSKFIEAHRSVLLELCDLALPAQGIDFERTGIGKFAARYGFLDKPLRIRFRVLDQRINFLSSSTYPDVTLDVASFAELSMPLQRVFITENETNFLAFPIVTNSIVIFGAGYGWDALARVSWLDHCTIHYWGDIDTHGFAILDQLRSRFKHVESFLMDRSTLIAHEPLWGEESVQVNHNLLRLDEAEQSLFDELRDNHIRNGLRLEQERIGFEWLTAALKSIGCNQV